MWADSPHTNHNTEGVEGYKVEIQQILSTLNAQNTSPDENVASESTDSVGPPTTSTAEGAIWRLIKRAFTLPDRSSLIEAVFSSKDGSKVVRGLHEDDAQSFVDVIDEALLNTPDLSPPIRRECLKSMYRTCGRHALLPTAMKVVAQYDRTGGALYRGGFADVWKGDHCGREVAVKVIRTYAKGDLRKVVGRFCKEVVTWRTLRHPNILPLIGVMMTESQFAMISDWMENGNINEFVKANPEADKFGLLGEVATGLIYIHSQGMIHGDLKGANILIDQAGHARLADFGLLTVLSDPANLLSSSSYTQGGTARWMSPELINPQKFGFENSCPTKSSDCYALGMVIYETISGRLPFHRYTDLTVFVKVLEGESPLREARFADSLWEMLELCWEPRPEARPSIEYVLHHLEKSSQSGESMPSSSELNGEVDEGGWDSGSDSSSSAYNQPSGSILTADFTTSSDLIYPKSNMTPLQREVANLRAKASLADTERRRFKEEKQWALSQGNSARAEQMGWQVKRYTALVDNFHKEADAKLLGASGLSLQQSNPRYPLGFLSAAPPPVQIHTHPGLTEEWDETYLTVLGAQDLGQLRELLARSIPEVVMPLDSTPPLSQAVILVLVHRLAAAIGEIQSPDETFRSTSRWLWRAASVLDPSDPTISSYVPRVLPTTQETLDSAKQRLVTLPGGPQIVDAARTITDVQEILGRHHPNTVTKPWTLPTGWALIPTAPQAPHSVPPPPVKAPGVGLPPSSSDDWEEVALRPPPPGPRRPRTRSTTRGGK